MSYQDDFNSRVLSWVQTKDPMAAEVQSVTGCGTDWAGDTDHGFYDEFEATIDYAHADGESYSLRPSGADMAELWKMVVS